MESIKHYFANTLNFDDKFYKGMDQAIVFFFEAYVSMQDEYAKKIMHTPKNEINIYHVQDNYLLNFIRYGLALIDGGIHPNVTEMLLMNAHEVLLDKCNSEEKDVLRLQLLYVMQSIKLIYFDKKSFLSFTDHVASTQLDTSNIHHYFKL